MSNNDNVGYVYVMENETFPGLLKIGRTSNTPIERAKNFDTGLPKPWTVVCAVQLHEYKLLEKTLHNLFTFRRLKKDREFFYFSYEDEAEKRDIVQLFRFFTLAATEYKIEDAKEEIAEEVEYYENKPADNSVFVLKKTGEILIQATLDAESNEFIFDRDVPNIAEPNFHDSNGSSIRSAKSLYAAFVADGEIDENGTFLLKGKRVSPLRMNRYTVVLLNASANWKTRWYNEFGGTYKDILESGLEP
jgi:hypothetical protein